jgi:hypothetical protein
MSPDCDLEQDFAERMGSLSKTVPSDKLIPSVFLLQAITVDELRSTTPPGRERWKRISQNKDERYHVLEDAEAKYDAGGQGLPALGIDFKRYFTIPTDELYVQFETNAQRRCHLQSPYAEHLSQRLTDFLSRVALPREHKVE